MELNLDDRSKIHTYQVFEGRYVDVIRILLADKRITPMPISSLLERRLQVLDTKDKYLIQAWWNNSFSSPDGIAYKNDEIKVVPNARPLLDITKDSELSDGALVLTDEQYEGLEGKTFSRESLRLYSKHSDSSTKRKVLENKIWQVVVGDNELLKNYVDAHFRRYKHSTGMSIYLSDGQNQPIMRPLELNAGRSGSDLDDIPDIDSNVARDDARLIGVPYALINFQKPETKSIKTPKKK